MAGDYFSDRTSGRRPRVSEEIDERVWAAILALLRGGIDGARFAADFPISCEDGGGPYACDSAAMMSMVRAEIPELGDRLDEHSVPPTPDVLDLVEFMYRHSSEPSNASYHSFFKHHHLRFDRAKGRAAFRESVSRLLARAGLAFELDADGHAQRRLPSAIAAER